MPKSNNFLQILLCFLFFISQLTISESINTTLPNLLDHKVRREVPETKKYLLFPQGSNVQLIYCMTIGTYARPGGFFTMGVTAGLAYELPHKRTVLFRKPAEVYHRRSRRELYQKLELMLKTQGKDGKECVLKALCNAGKRKRTKEGKGSFIEEILHSIFTLPSGSYHLDPKTEYEKAHETDVDCNKAFPSCADSIFD